MDYGAIRAHVRRLVRRTVHGLPGGLLVLLLAVADATPLEPLHLKGIQDGGDYDSLIQPLVLSLAAVPESPILLLIPLWDRPDRLDPFGFAILPECAVSSVQSRAPPAH